MGRNSPVKLHLQTQLSDSLDAVSQEQLYEQYVSMYPQAFYPIAQLACFSLPDIPDSPSSIRGKVSSTGTTQLRFRVLPSPDGLTLELLPETAIEQERLKKAQESLTSKAERSSSSGFGKAFSEFLSQAFSTIIANLPFDFGYRIDSGSKLQQRLFLDQIVLLMMQNHRRMMREWALWHERWLEQRERDKSDIKKEEEKKQEQRLSIQKVEEPKRQTHRLSIQKDEATKALGRAHTQKAGS